MPVSLPSGQHYEIEVDSVEKLSNAWYHSLAPEGIRDVGRKILFCQVTECTCTALDMQPGQNATFACALDDPLCPLPHQPLPEPTVIARMS